MNLTVKRDGARHVLDWGKGPRVCAVGRGGIGEKRAEGDGVTPAGVWPLRRVFYRPDHMDAPKTVLPVIQIEEEDGWCDAAADVNYNRLVQLPYPSHAEAMWRADGLLLHVAKPDFAPTEGCVAAKQEDLLEALAQLARGDRIRIEN